MRPCNIFHETVNLASLYSLNDYINRQDGGLVQFLNRHPSHVDLFGGKLPDDLWNKIIGYLENGERRKMRLVNRRMFWIIEKLLGDTIGRQRSFILHFRSIADVYLTECIVIYSFRSEGKTQRFSSKWSVFSQIEMKQISHSLRKLDITKVWIDLNPERISPSKRRNILRSYARLLAASLRSDAVITITHPSPLMSEGEEYSFIFKRISGKARSLIYPFCQFSTTYEKIVMASLNYDWKEVTIQFLPFGKRLSPYGGVLFTLETLLRMEDGTVLGNIGKLSIIQLTQKVTKEYISALVEVCSKKNITLI